MVDDSITTNEPLKCLKVVASAKEVIILTKNTRLSKNDSWICLSTAVAKNILMEARMLNPNLNMYYSKAKHIRIESYIHISSSTLSQSIDIQ